VGLKSASERLSGARKKRFAASIQAKIAHSRSDFLHKLSHRNRAGV